MKLLVDTNIWLRYLVRDDEDSYRSCLKLIQAIEKGKIRPYVSAIILLEVYYVLTSYYKISKIDAQEIIDKICQTRGLVIIEKTDFHKAFKLHKKTGIKLADCLIATQIGKGQILCTYDQEFEKIRGINKTTPEEVVVNEAL